MVNTLLLSYWRSSAQPPVQKLSFANSAENLGKIIYQSFLVWSIFAWWWYFLYYVLPLTLVLSNFDSLTYFIPNIFASTVTKKSFFPIPCPIHNKVLIFLLFWLLQSPQSVNRNNKQPGIRRVSNLTVLCKHSLAILVYSWWGRFSQKKFGILA